MELYRYLTEHTTSDHAFIAITGAGGKTTLMTRFAQYLKGLGKSVLITTTTKVLSPYGHGYQEDLVFCDDAILAHEPEKGKVVFYAIGSKEDRKWTSPPFEILAQLKERYDVVLCEADGARMRPVKVHTSRDPVVPDFSTDTISVLGLWALGKPVWDVVFGDDRNLTVDFAYVKWLIHEPEGLLKGSVKGHRTILFNGADACDYAAMFDLGYPEDVCVLAAALDKGVLYGKIQ